MSVIVGRALPDVRDGLKPVQRRILYAMHELGLTPDRPYRKCARVVGDVLGKYHPHGDQAVYDALVRLVQNFASRYPVLDGHGNFGSVDDDPPAAMRYTESRLAPIAQKAILEEIASETVSFAPNFDGSQQEPTVLPSQLPFLLLNGCSGIAVGMATSIPPHNLNEIVDGLIALIKKPELSDEKLLKIIPGPDFPTGGEILLGSGIRETYTKGKGSIPMRGMTHVEEIYLGKGKHKRTGIIITELPYQLSKAGWIEKLADLVNDGKLNGIADIRDESDRDGMRIVVELRRDAIPDKIISDLQRRTALQNNFGAILLALVDGQPKQLSLKQLLINFLEFRELTIIKRTQYALNKTKNRFEVVEGLIIALTNLKEVIEMIQNAKDATEAKSRLIIRLNLTEKQSEAVLGMPLRKLTTLEQKGLHKEATELRDKQQELQYLIENRDKLLETMINEFKKLKKEFGNPRLTKLVEGGDDLLAEKHAIQRPNAESLKQQALEALPQNGNLLIQNDNQVKILTSKTINRLQLTESAELGDGETSAKLLWPISQKPKILAITESGKVALLKWEFAGQQPGNIENFLPGGIEGEHIVNLLVIPKEETGSLGLLSSDGRFKRLPLKEIIDLSGRATTILKLKNNVNLKSSIICPFKGSVTLVTNIGRLLKLEINETNMPIMGKLAQGPLIMRLFPHEEIVGAVSYPSDNNNSIILGTKEGKIIKIKNNYLKESKKGNLGEIKILFNDTVNPIDRVIKVCPDHQVIGITTSLGRKGRITSDQINVELNEGTLVYQTPLKNNEYIEEFISLIEPDKEY